MAENTLYFGDNLKILRDNIRDETADLIYLDPPFNSRYPDLTHGGLTFKKAKKEKTEEQLTLGDDVAF